MVKLSIIIPSFNRPENLKIVLKSIKRQRDVETSEFEIIVVYSTNDNILKLKYKEIFLSYSDNIRSFFINIPSGPGNFKNIGVEKAESNLILFTDDDCILTPFFLKNLLKFSNENIKVKMWGGLSITGSNSINATLGERIAFNINSWNKPIFNNNEIFFVPGLNMCVRREEFLQVGGFSKQFSNYCEDSELTLKFKKNNFIISYNEKQILFHKPIFDFYKILIKFFNYGKGNGKLRFYYNNYPKFNLKNFFGRNISYLTYKSSNKKKDLSLIIAKILKDIFYYSGELFSLVFHHF